ncbi:META domain-containing protein [Mameliella sp. CS4]|uniref:META domain-containing protein n=1 Tax=Mameliella sp. CS4 TaxID=2862329 RepID=UPI001C5FE749|nr:META domain-containing protein [Mameliella sp. CS4]MBW4982596.1 META domain-containing protein [Mameliella sp. CS4]
MRGLILAGLLSALVPGAWADMTLPPENTHWVLQSMGGEMVDFDASLDLTTPGKVSGKAPCNSFGGRVEGAWPGLSFGPLRLTRRACPELAQENAFVMALRQVTQAELRDDQLVLRDAEGNEMVFSPAP